MTMKKIGYIFSVITAFAFETLHGATSSLTSASDYVYSVPPYGTMIKGVVTGTMPKSRILRGEDRAFISEALAELLYTRTGLMIFSFGLFDPIPYDNHQSILLSTFYDSIYSDVTVNRRGKVTGELYGVGYLDESVTFSDEIPMYIPADLSSSNRYDRIYSGSTGEYVITNTFDLSYWIYRHSPLKLARVVEWFSMIDKLQKLKLGFGQSSYDVTRENEQKFTQYPYEHLFCYVADGQTYETQSGPCFITQSISGTNTVVTNTVKSIRYKYTYREYKTSYGGMYRTYDEDTDTYKYFDEEYGSNPVVDKWSESNVTIADDGAFYVSSLLSTNTFDYAGFNHIDEFKVIGTITVDVKLSGKYTNEVIYTNKVVKLPTATIGEYGGFYPDFVKIRLPYKDTREMMMSLIPEYTDLRIELPTPKVEYNHSRIHENNAGYLVSTSLWYAVSATLTLGDIRTIITPKYRTTFTD